MRNRCSLNPCCGDQVNCKPPVNEDSTSALKPMTPSRAIYFLKRFKREEKLLGPNEQLAIDFSIEVLSGKERANR
jgi:hypothetical protein